MADNKPPRITKPESLEAKFALLCRLPYDPRARRKHALVFGFILDWYHSRYGDALASVRHVVGKLQERDPAGKGLYIGEVHSALSDLVEWGYLAQEKGKGRRASRYVPNWSLLEPSVHKIPNANDNDRSVLVSPNASVLETPNATAFSVLYSLNEDPLTPTRSLDPGTVCNEVSAPGMAPEGPAGAGKFERVWIAYGKYGSKVASRKAFAAITNPDVDLIIARASSWCASAKPGQKRMPLERWLTEEKYDEADRAVGTKAAPSAPRTSKAKASERPAVQTITIFDATEMQNGQRKELHLTADEFKHVIVVECPDHKEQERGQKLLHRLVCAAGIDGDIQDARELIFKTVDVTWDGDMPVFSRTTRSETDPVVSGGLETNPPEEDAPRRPAKPKRRLEPKTRTREEELAWLRRSIAEGMFNDD